MPFDCIEQHPVNSVGDARAGSRNIDTGGYPSRWRGVERRSGQTDRRARPREPFLPETVGNIAAPNRAQDGDRALSTPAATTAKTQRDCCGVKDGMDEQTQHQAGVAPTMASKVMMRWPPTGLRPSPASDRGKPTSGEPSGQAGRQCVLVSRVPAGEGDAEDCARRARTRLSQTRGAHRAGTRQQQRAGHQRQRGGGRERRPPARHTEQPDGGSRSRSRTGQWSDALGEQWHLPRRGTSWAAAAVWRS